MKYRCSALLGILAFFAYMPGASAAPGPFCDVTLFPPDSIQVAVDGVGEGGVVCLGGGTYYLGTTIDLDSAHTGLTLKAAEGAYPILEAVSTAIRLTEAHETTISGLTLVGPGSIDPGNAIHIFHSNNVTVANNEIREFRGGVIVTPSLPPPTGGTPINSSGFVLSDNSISVRSDGALFLNCSGCSAIRNQIDTQGRAIFVWADNNVRGLTEEEIVRGTKIVENRINAVQRGILVLAEASTDWRNEIETFVSMEVVSIQQNQITSRNPILGFALTEDHFHTLLPATAKIKNLGLIRNEIVCVPFSGSGKGVELLGQPDRAPQVATIENTKIIRNTFSGCLIDVDERNNVERTALSPDLRELLDSLDAAATDGAL